MHLKKIGLWVLWFLVCVVVLFLVVVVPMMLLVGNNNHTGAVLGGLFILFGLPVLSSIGASVITHRKTMHDHRPIIPAAFPSSSGEAVPETLEQTQARLAGLQSQVADAQKPKAVRKKPSKLSPVVVWLMGAFSYLLITGLAIFLWFQVINGMHASLVANSTTVGTITDQTHGRGCSDTAMYRVDGHKYTVNSSWHCGGSIGHAIKVRYDSAHPATASIDTTTDLIVGAIFSTFGAMLATAGSLFFTWGIWSERYHHKRRKSAVSTPI